MTAQMIGVLNPITVSALNWRKKIHAVVEMGRLTHIAGGAFDEWMLYDPWKRQNQLFK